MEVEMRTTVLNALATVALFVAGSTDAVAQLRREIHPTEQFRDPRVEETIRSSNIPESEKSRLLRIVGGFPTTIESNPWQVALILGLSSEPQRDQFCGGSIIDPEWVVTAAHCMDNEIVNGLPDRVNVVAGTTNYQSGGQRVAVKRIFVHPAWNSATTDNDVALLQLSRRLTLSTAEGSRMRAIALAPAGTANYLMLVLKVSGWGATLEGRSGSPSLLAAYVPLVAKTLCNAPDSYAGQITANMFCAGRQEGGVDSCQGDSGGPIVTTGTTPTLVGVVSHGDGCARRLKFGVYTTLANYTARVQRTMRQPREEDSTERMAAAPSETSAGATGRMSVPPSETSVAANQLDVNASEWSQLSQNEKEAIEVILRRSRLIEDDVVIAPRR